MYLITYDHQFGFKSKHSTDMCIFTVKSIVKYYTRQNSPVYTCFLDASKAFDRINHWTLFRKLIDYQVPLLIVRILIFGIKCSLCVLNGALLFLNTFAYLMVFGKVVYCLPNYLHYIRTGCPVLFGIVKLVVILMNNV